VVHIGLLASGHTAIDLSEQPLVQHLEQDHALQGQHQASTQVRSGQTLILPTTWNNALPCNWCVPDCSCNDVEKHVLDAVTTGIAGCEGT
jgi:hypothetical protein